MTPRGRVISREAAETAKVASRFASTKYRIKNNVVSRQVFPMSHVDFGAPCSDTSLSFSATVGRAVLSARKLNTPAAAWTRRVQETAWPQGATREQIKTIHFRAAARQTSSPHTQTRARCSAARGSHSERVLSRFGLLGIARSCGRRDCLRNTRLDLPDFPTRPYIPEGEAG